MLPKILPRVLAHDHEPTDSELELLSVICDDAPPIEKLFIDMFSLLKECQLLH